MKSRHLTAASQAAPREIDQTSVMIGNGKVYDAKGAFEPEELVVLVAAFDEAWRRLEKSGVRFESDYELQRARNTLGKYIIEEAKKGERDKRRLRDQALLLYAQARYSHVLTGPLFSIHIFISL
jgi:hypothetical protein